MSCNQKWHLQLSLSAICPWSHSKSCIQKPIANLCGLTHRRVTVPIRSSDWPSTHQAMQCKLPSVELRQVLCTPQSSILPRAEFVLQPQLRTNEDLWAWSWFLTKLPTAIARSLMLLPSARFSYNNQKNTVKIFEMQRLHHVRSVTTHVHGERSTVRQPWNILGLLEREKAL